MNAATKKPAPDLDHSASKFRETASLALAAEKIFRERAPADAAHYVRHLGRLVRELEAEFARYL